MRVQLPAFCTASSFQGVLAQVFDENARPRTNEYVFDFSALKKADTWSWMGLGNLYLWLKAHQIKTFATPAIFNEGKAFPITSAAAEQFLSMDEEGDLLAASRIMLTDAAAWLDEIFGTWLMEEIEVGAFLTNSIVDLLKDLCSFVASFNREMLICASHNHESMVSVWMAASGPDLPTIGRQAIASSVSDLIALAFLTENGKGINGKCNHEPYLSSFLHELVTHYWGEIQMFSGFADFRYVHNDDGLYKKISVSNAYCPGFLAEIRLPVTRAYDLSLLNEPRKQSSLAL